MVGHRGPLSAGDQKCGCAAFGAAYVVQYMSSAAAAVP